uniref:NADH-ubiquinone oxidoreductase chain 5 n=1 Tax=Mastigeulota kiangsinensis TaxID=1544384 RepID=A0A0U1XAI8_MASKI|nr:NADH dehydrogenase subunit 5 [Mastigeulota kiangsinensis]AIN75490.1 NADH dehydrogenase subunit 5 [Mastigeulota kiangsinensis]
MLEKFHKQRLSVLLLTMSVGTIFLYCVNSMTNWFTYMVNLEILYISTNYITLSLLVDKVSISFSALVTFISACVFMFSRWYMKDDPFYFRFSWILLSFVISMNILVYSGSLLMLLVGWDGLGVSSFALIVYYQSGESVRAGFLTLLVNRLGDILIMVTMFYFVMVGSSLLVNYSTVYMFAMLCLLGVASLTKSAQYPFSAWLPAAMAAPTPVSALVHSSTLVTAGIYIMIRAFMTMNINPTLSAVFLFCGSLTSLIGGACALNENDIKKVVAFSTLSQLGIMVFCLGLGSPDLALLHLYTHAMFKAMLFLVAGFILMLSFGVQDMRLLGAVTKNTPYLLIFLNTSTMCLMGIPFLSAYYSKHAILSLCLSSSVNLFSTLTMGLAVVLTSVYMIRMLKSLNWRSCGSVVLHHPQFPFHMYAPCMLLYCGSVFLGWGFNMADPTYIASTFLPNILNLLVNFLLLIGLFVGLIFMKRRGVLMLVNMFYMDPFWGSMSRIGNKAYVNLKNVEYGWAEPYCYSSSVKGGLTWLNTSLSWSKSSFSFSKHGVCLICIFVLCMYLS